MTWMSDEAYEYVSDCRDKKITARSARNMRTHNGKRGSVKLPSDYMSKKELNAMNGECKSYRMGSPVTWDEFKTWPDEHKKTYIMLVREKYKVPDTALAEAMGASSVVFGKWVRCLGLSLGKGAGAAGRHWYKTENHEKFVAWWNGVKMNTPVVEEEPEVATVRLDEAIEVVEVEENDPEQQDTDVDATVDKYLRNEAEEGDTCSKEKKCAVPVTGDMTFDGAADDILCTIGMLLQNNIVHLSIQWTVN